MPCGYPEKPPHTSIYSVVIYTFPGHLGVYDLPVWIFVGNRDLLNSGLGGVRDIASVIISNEQTQSDRVCCDQNLDVVWPKDLFSDYLLM